MENISLKITFLGDSQCGKTNLIKNILYGKYFEHTDETVVNYYHVELNNVDNFTVSLNLL